MGTEKSIWCPERGVIIEPSRVWSDYGFCSHQPSIFKGIPLASLIPPEQINPAFQRFRCLNLFAYLLCFWIFVFIYLEISPLNFPFSFSFYIFVHILFMNYFRKKMFYVDIKPGKDCKTKNANTASCLVLSSYFHFRIICQRVPNKS